MTASSTILEKYRRGLISLPLSAVWRGHGSALFLEFGHLSPQMKRNGSPANPQGDFTVMIEWSWRIENDDSILCGSWSDEENWDEIFRSLIGRKVQDISVFGRLPELAIALTGGRHVTSFMTADGQPAWAVFDRSVDPSQAGCASVRDGEIYEE
ncbi:MULTISPECIES: hypothetical protein [unclassified Rhizobium]|uniref:hypothetical protein n=1 Tax=unclassified Rhizobium TaxID=2613769 RepID=UPI001FCCC5F5|nr:MULTISPECIES: hypothetical protein [unclassified Rhizobium]